MGGGGKGGKGGDDRYMGFLRRGGGMKEKGG